MQREDFEYLYIHANCLAELAFQQFAADFEEELLKNPVESSTLSREEMEAQAHAQLAQLDLSSMMDDMPWDNPESDAAVLREFDKLQEEAAGEELESHDKATEKSPDDPSADSVQFDLSSYLKEAYGAREKILDRITPVMSRVDMKKLEILISELPSELPLLTGPLKPEAFEKLLTCYRDEHKILTSLVMLIRDADFGL